MILMYEGANYQIFANPELGLYELINKKSSLSEADDRVYPKLLIAMREFDRQIGLSNQEKETPNAVVPFTPR